MLGVTSPALFGEECQVRNPIFFLLSLFIANSYAANNDIATIRTETLSITIGPGGPEGDKLMISFSTRKHAGESFKDFEPVPFLSECAFIKNGFKCRSKGKTPLAGATYKKSYFGRSQHESSCEASIKEPIYTEPGEKYICVKGCAKPTVPEFLYGDDGSC